MAEFVTRYFAQLVPGDCISNPTDPTVCNAEDLYTLAVNVIVFLRNTSILIVVLFIMWGGFLMLTSSGSPDRLSQGKKAITAAIIGLVIVITAFFVVNLFITEFTKCGDDWWRWNPDTESVSCG